MRAKFAFCFMFLLLFSGLGLTSVSLAALSLDRSRIIFNEKDKAVSLHVTNQDQHFPYLAQTWIEDSKGKKITSPLMSLPPVQRIEANGISQVRLQLTAVTDSLPDDRETVFYFYFREIPPKSTRANTVMLAIENQLKVFYRPKAISVDKMQRVLPGLQGITVEKKNNHYEVNNPTPYYFTIVEARESIDGKPIEVEPTMIPPKKAGMLPDDFHFSGNKLSLIFVTDYAEQRALTLNCAGTLCTATGIEILPVIKKS